MSTLTTPDKIQNIQEYVSAWQIVRKELLDVLGTVAPENFQKTAVSGWNPSEIAEHLYLTQFNVARVIPVILAGKFGLTREEIPALDYSKSYDQIARPRGVKNPDTVSPTGKMAKDEALESLQKAMDKLIKNTTGKSPDDLRSRGLDHPLLGKLSLLDWLWVMILHEGSHLSALKAKVQ